MAEKQVEFDPMQTHDKRFEYAMIVICLICIAVVLVITQLTTWGHQG
ncbi:MAG: hypothetical protein ACJ740_02645 [Gaiellales bacterium]